MAVQDRSPESKKFLSLQKKCRVCYDGEEAIHNDGKEYLPGFNGDENEVKQAYEDYKRRALFYNTFSRTVQFFKGLILRKGVSIDKEDKIDKELLESVDDSNTTFRGFCSIVAEETLKVGFGGILVDYDQVPDEVETVKESKSLGLKAKMKWYPAESILSTRKNIRLFEEEYINSDEFSEDTRIQIRVLDLDDGGYYRQRVFIENTRSRKFKKEWIQIGPDIYPLMNGQKLTEIPFFPCSADKNSLEVTKPPLIDLAETNIHHYGVYADYRNGIHFTGFPQLYIAGKTDESKTYQIGSSVAWGFEDPSTSVKFAEFNGKGLEHPERLLNRLEGYMGKLGARMLMTEKNRSESAEKVTIDNESESATLSLIAQNCSESLTKALNMYLKWNQSDVECNVELDSDFSFMQLDPAVIIALMKGVQSGLITKEIFLYNIKKGELVPDDKSLGQLLSEVEEWEKEVMKRNKEQAELNQKNGSRDPLSERNSLDLKDPKDELRDNTRSKTDYDLEE